MFIITFIVDAVSLINDGINEICRFIAGPEEKK